MVIEPAANGLKTVAERQGTEKYVDGKATF
jgi:hypothetical protein